MNAKQWTIIGLGIFFLPVIILIGGIMTLCGHDPFRELHRITHDAR